MNMHMSREFSLHSDWWCSETVFLSLEKESSQLPRNFLRKRMQIFYYQSPDMDSKLKRLERFFLTEMVRVQEGMGISQICFNFYENEEFMFS